MSEPLTEEPRKRGTFVRDRDGHVWKRGNTRWTCQTPIGTSYLDKRARRMRTVESVGRLPWHGLVNMYGPLTLVEDR